MKRLLTVLCALVATSVSAYASDREDVTLVRVDLEAGKLHEECLRVEAGQKRRWFWKSSAPVDFNIHYHRGSEVFYPVKREQMRGDGGTFVAKSGEDYCWMWTAKEKATLEGRIELK